METKGLKLIGKGLFSKVYDLGNGQVLIKSKDLAKECMGLGWFPESDLFPKLDMLECGIYTSKKYEKVSSLKNSLDTDQWILYKELRAIFNSVSWCQGYKNLYETFSESLLPCKVKEDILEALDGLANFGYDVCFEISPRNVATDNGKLILLDVFFFQSQVKEARG